RARALGMERLAGVLLHVHAQDAAAARLPVHLEVELAMLAQRLVVLRDLVALRQVGIEIVLAIEFRLLANATAEPESGLDGEIERVLVQYRQYAGLRGADRADSRIGNAAESDFTSAEQLGIRCELHVHLETDDRFKLHVRRPREHDRNDYCIQPPRG